MSHFSGLFAASCYVLHESLPKDLAQFFEFISLATSNTLSMGTLFADTGADGKLMAKTQLQSLNDFYEAVRADPKLLGQIPSLSPVDGVLGSGAEVVLLVILLRYQWQWRWWCSSARAACCPCWWAFGNNSIGKLLS